MNAPVQIPAPIGLLAELTHRCPLRCPYCSNPVALDRGGTELTTEEWKKVLTELAEIGVLQIHFSGGEPTARKDIVELVQHATDVGLYSNLITSAVLLTRDKLSALADAGLCHVQISFQGNEPVVADRVAGLKNAHGKKIEAAKWTRELELPLTVNAVCTGRTCISSPTSSRWRSISTPTGWKSPMCSITAGL